MVLGHEGYEGGGECCKAQKTSEMGLLHQVCSIEEEHFFVHCLFLYKVFFSIILILLYLNLFGVFFFIGTTTQMGT